MNRLMGIDKDKGISKVECATEEEVEEFQEGIAEGPDLSPMRPYLNSSRRTAWNNSLCEKFIEHFEEEMEVELTGDNITMVENMFLDRLNRLVRPWKESQTFSPRELHERDLNLNQKARRNTRRVDVSNLRILDILKLMNHPAVLRATRNMPREHEESRWFH